MKANGKKGIASQGHCLGGKSTAHATSPKWQSWEWPGMESEAQERTPWGPRLMGMVLEQGIVCSVSTLDTTSNHCGGWTGGSCREGIRLEAGRQLGAYRNTPGRQ